MKQGTSGSYYVTPPILPQAVVILLVFLFFMLAIAVVALGVYLIYKIDAMNICSCCCDSQPAKRNSEEDEKGVL